MKKLLLLSVLVAVTGCSGVSTGRKAPCYGNFKADGNYLLNISFGATQVSADWVTQDDCGSVEV